MRSKELETHLANKVIVEFSDEGTSVEAFESLFLVDDRGNPIEAPQSMEKYPSISLIYFLWTIDERNHISITKIEIQLCFTISYWWSNNEKHSFVFYRLQSFFFLFCTALKIVFSFKLFFFSFWSSTVVSWFSEIFYGRFWGLLIWWL